ncbi:tyrosine-type recombinase/integrase [Streptomyces sp. NBC_00829]|uniref:tyrosine-type recombinase/integrase n=1 Tax=Streptomyces sp. NBC_00829 TaxID=2903679 RepID=UPI002F910D54|nr:tyrosine-type recombinase/integrase [Streptomyces sp. NBC_00829]
MSALRRHLADYLIIRRGMGFKLERAESLLGQFLDYIEHQRGETVTIEHALAWATAPGGAGWWHALRMSAIRPFAVYLHALDPAHQVPPPGLISYGSHRATPYLYSDADIHALLQAASCHPGRRTTTLTYPALIGLLAATGMRIGEALALDTGDFDAERGILTIRDTKFGKSRLLPLHSTTTAALGQYLEASRRQGPAPRTEALFLSTAGTRLHYDRVHKTFRRMTRDAGLVPRSAACRPRVHDLRHSFAVTTLLEGYRRGDDMRTVIPRLSTYLGHADPKHTYWYLSAAPELLALAGDRLESYLEDLR